jgi:hypothetical protein
VKKGVKRDEEEIDEMMGEESERELEKRKNGGRMKKTRERKKRQINEVNANLVKTSNKLIG